MAVDSAYQQIVDAVVERFKLIRAGRVITTVEGDEYVFKTDMGLHVFSRLKRQLIPATDFPCLDLLDDPDRVEYDGAPFGYQNNYLKFHADCFTTGKSADSSGRRAYADVAAAIGHDPSFGQLARGAYTSMAGNPAEIQMEIGGNIVAGTRVSFRVMYRSKKWQV